jgi:two-component system, OmpR family, response regulator MprA
MQRILVIDDDAAVTSLLKRGLSYEGFAVDVATSGTEGLSIARERPADLVVLDVMMPGIDGLQVLERLRAADAQLPIVLVTARDAAADQVKGLGLGADDYIIKPFTFEVLAARLRAHLRRSEAEHVPVLRFEDLVLDTGTRLAHRGERDVELTTTEYGLLREFLLHPRRVLPKDFLISICPDVVDNIQHKHEPFQAHGFGRDWDQHILGLE